MKWRGISNSMLYVCEVWYESDWYVCKSAAMEAGGYVKKDILGMPWNGHAKPQHTTKFVPLPPPLSQINLDAGLPFRWVKPCLFKAKYTVH